MIYPTKNIQYTNIWGRVLSKKNNKAGTLDQHFLSQARTKNSRITPRSLWTKRYGCGGVWWDVGGGPVCPGSKPLEVWKLGSWSVKKKCDPKFQTECLLYGSTTTTTQLYSDITQAVIVRPQMVIFFQSLHRRFSPRVSCVARACAIWACAISGMGRCSCERYSSFSLGLKWTVPCIFLRSIRKRMSISKKHGAGQYVDLSVVNYVNKTINTSSFIWQSVTLSTTSLSIVPYSWLWTPATRSLATSKLHTCSHCNALEVLETFWWKRQETYIYIYKA